MSEGFENIIIPILGVLVTILSALLGFALYRHRKLAKYYYVRSKKSSSLRRKDVLGIRARRDLGFSRYYYERNVDTLIREALQERRKKTKQK